MYSIGKSEFRLDIYTENENDIRFDDGATNIIKRISPTNITGKNNLKSKDFHFLDRIFVYSINLAQSQETRDKITEKLIDFPFKISNEITEEMYELACAVYTTDRRFHLTNEFNQPFANKMIKEYFELYRKRKLQVFLCRLEEKLVGYTIVEIGDKGCFENLIGVTEQSIKGKMIAYRLYDYMLNAMMEQGYNRYIGRVSSINIASQNLHIQLGGKVMDIYDEYVWRKGEK